jgi:hypothetical protein
MLWLGRLGAGSTFTSHHSGVAGRRLSTGFSVWLGGGALCLKLRVRSHAGVLGLLAYLLAVVVQRGEVCV